MSFLYPFIFFYSATLAIPVAIHLFNFRARKKIYFSDIRLLKAIRIETRSSRSIKKYLILISRLLFLSFLILSFARPFKNEVFNSSNVGNNNASIIVDASPSMLREVEEGRSAKSLIPQILNTVFEGYGDNQNIQIVDNSGLVYSAQEFQNKTSYLISNQSKTLRELLNITKKKATPNNTDGGKGIFIISDFQKTFSGGLEDLVSDSLFNYNLVDFSSAEKSNIFVDSLYFEDDLSSDQIKLNVIISNSGNVSRDTYLNLLKDDAVYASNSVLIGPDAQMEITFDLKRDSTDFLGEIRIEDNPVTFDNSFFFVLGKRPKASIVHLTNTVTAEKGVFDRLFLDNPGFSYEKELLGNYNLSNLDDLDLLIINLSVNNEDKVSSILKAASVYSLNVLLVPDQYDPAVFKGLNGEYKKGNSDQSRINIEDFDHPIFKNVFSTGFNISKAEMPVSVRPLILPGQSGTILSNDYGEPILSKLQGSSTYLLGIPLDVDYTNLSRHAIFLPMIYNLARSSSEFKKPYYRLNQDVFTVNPDSTINQNQVFNLQSRENQIIPNQWLSNEGLNIDISGTDLAQGHYHLTSSEYHLATLAFNHDKFESDLSEYSLGDLQKLFENVDHVEVYSYEDFYGTEPGRAGIGSGDYWRYFLIVAILFLFTEIAFIRFL